MNVHTSLLSNNIKNFSSLNIAKEEFDIKKTTRVTLWWPHYDRAESICSFSHDKSDEWGSEHHTHFEDCNDDEPKIMHIEDNLSLHEKLQVIGKSNKVRLGNVGP